MNLSIDSIKKSMNKWKYLNLRKYLLKKIDQIELPCSVHPHKKN